VLAENSRGWKQYQLRKQAAIQRTCEIDALFDKDLAFAKDIAKRKRRFGYLLFSHKPEDMNHVGNNKMILQQTENDLNNILIQDNINVIQEQHNERPKLLLKQRLGKKASAAQKLDCK